MTRKILIAILIVIGLLIFGFALSGYQYPGDSRNGPTACTMEAKQCPDGSYVGRTGPNCEFSPCPSEALCEGGSCPTPGGNLPGQNPGQNNPGPTACTADAKICPDGSAVGRTGPNCEFAQCPGQSNGGGNNQTALTYCHQSQRNADACIEIYQPVCGRVQVECITTPCNPVLETYPNSCHACSNSRVIGYTEGQC